MSAEEQTPRAWLARLLAEEREAGRLGDEVEGFLSSDVDLRTLLGEFTALKSELRAETVAAREQRELVQQVLAQVEAQQEAVAALQRGQPEGQRAALEKLEHKAAMALIEAIDRLQPSIESARRLAAPQKRWFRAVVDPVAVGLLEGLQLSAQRLTLQLEQWQVAPIEALGRSFDPTCMEAVDTRASSQHKDAEVLDVITSGYRGPQGVLRPAQVIVNKLALAAPEEREGP